MMRVHGNDRASAPAIANAVDDWRERQLCSQPGINADGWHVDALGGKPKADGALATARHMCVMHCPVIRDCYAATVGQRWLSTCVGGLIYDIHGELTKTQPMAERCVLCRHPPAQVDRLARRRRQWRESAQRLRDRLAGTVDNPADGPEDGPEDGS